MRKIALLIIAVCSSVWGTVSSTAQTAHFLVPFTDLGLRSNIVRSVTLTPIARTLDTAGVIRLPDPITYGVGAHPEMTNGSVTFSNRLTGYAMRFDLSTAYSVYSYTSCVPTNVTGLVNVTDYGGVIVGMVSGIVNPFAFFNPQLNAQFSNSVAAIVAESLPDGIVTNNATGVTLSGTFGGNGVGLQLPNTATNALTNLTTYSMTFNAGETNPIFVYSQDRGLEVNGLYFWNTTIGRYTNNGSTNMMWKSPDNIDQWVIGSATNDPANNANILYYAGSTPSLPLNEPAGWLYLDGFGSDYATVLVGTVIATNALIYQTHKGIQITPDDTGGNINTNFAFSIKSIFGQTMLSRTIFYSALATYIAPYDYVEPGAAFVPNAFNNSTANDGLNGYAWNLASLYNTNSDKRFSIGVGFLHGTNGQNGCTFELLNQTRGGYNANASWVQGGFNRALVIDVKNGITVGGLPYNQHGNELSKLGWFNVAASSDTTRPQIVLENSGAYTGAMTNGAFYAEGNRVSVIQSSVKFPIPQINTTNATLSAQTSFTWKFTYPFSDTNYSVTMTGAGATLGTNIVIGSKTTTNVAITFPSYTGILNAIAARQ